MIVLQPTTRRSQKTSVHHLVGVLSDGHRSVGKEHEPKNICTKHQDFEGNGCPAGPCPVPDLFQSQFVSEYYTLVLKCIINLGQFLEDANLGKYSAGPVHSCSFCIFVVLFHENSLFSLI